MRSLLLADILEYLNATLLRGNKKLNITHVTTRPNSIKANTLYFHFRHKDKDLSNFCSGKASIVILTETPRYVTRLLDENITVLKVRDIKEAYWEFVKYYRILFKIPVIGVTGACGKTTTTEMLKKILSTKYATQSTKEGLNGLGYNLGYLLSFDDNTQAGVFELGLKTQGWIEQSCRYFQPNVGVLLNIGVYHLEGCQTMENYSRRYLELQSAGNKSRFKSIKGNGGGKEKNCSDRLHAAIRRAGKGRIPKNRGRSG